MQSSSEIVLKRCVLRHQAIAVRDALTLPVSINVKFKPTSTAWTHLPQPREYADHTLEELLRQNFRYERWDGQ